MRSRGGADDSEAYELRMGREAPTYDGKNLRTGEEMTEEGWEALSASQGPGLPTWNPTRANDQVTIDLTVDIEPLPGADVIDLRGRQAASQDGPTTDEVFEMPAWARGEHIFRSERE